MNSTEIIDLFKRGMFGRLAEQAADSSAGILPLYLYLDALIRMKKFRQARALVEKEHSILEAHNCLPLVQTRLCTDFLPLDSELALKLVLSFKDLAANPFLLAEGLFTLGSISVQAESFGVAEAYFHGATQEYLKSKFPFLAWYTQFNACICLLRRRDFESFQSQRIALAQFESPYQLSRRRWIEGLMCIELGENELALEKFRQSKGVAEQDGDFGSAAASAPFLCYLGESEEYSEVPEENAFLQVSKAIEFVRRSAGALDKKRLEGLLQHWKKAELDPVSSRLLNYTILEVLLRQKKFSLVPAFCREFEKNILKRAPVLPMVDFGIPIATALLKVGKAMAAENIIQRLRAQYESEFSPYRDKLGALSQKEEDLATSPQSLSLVWLPEKNAIRFRGRWIALGRKPVIRELIALLAKKSAGFSYEEYVWEVFRVPYSSKLHDGRIRTLIARVNQVLGYDLIYTRQQRVLLSDFVSFRSFSFDHSVISFDGLTERQQEILKKFQDTQAARSLRDLVEKFGVSKRTLQGDLQTLVYHGHLTRAQKGRGTVYLPRISGSA